MHGDAAVEPDPLALRTRSRWPVRLAWLVVLAVTVAVLWHRQVLRGEAAPAVRLHAPGALLHASRWVDAGRVRQNRVWRRNR